MRTLHSRIFIGEANENGYVLSYRLFVKIS